MANITIKNKRMSLAQKILFKLLSKIQYGKITLHDGDVTRIFNGTEALDTHSVTVYVVNPRAYRTVLLEGSIGAGKSYMEGDWNTDNLSQLLEIFIRNTHLFAAIESPFARFVIFIRALLNKWRPNNIKRAKKNIVNHYDLGNKFFELFLDPTMMYSCALYETEQLSSEQASTAKLRTICEHLQLKPEDHVLEIGSGWGGFAIYAAREYGCKITTTTISNKQYAFVKQEIARLGLGNQIELLNIDYRKLTGSYDKLVSIEMVEAVGHKYFDTFFRKCNQLVKPEGLFFLQAIVINDQAYESSKHEIDFIKYYIFPGGCLPSVNTIFESIATQTKMQLMHLRDIGEHYVLTLNDWHKKLLANIPAIKQQDFSENFIRMWEFYFCYCAAGFQTNYISDIHALWRKRV
jgi:cyclopropane-fatty-acyl-phospholipid synthase